MTIRISGLTALALLAPFVVAGAARANPAVSFDASSPTAPAGEGLEVGWGFTPTVGITVTALGAYDPTNMGGTNPSGMVYLYNSMGTTLASVQITIGDSKEGTPPFYYANIMPVELTAGTTYYVAEDVGENTSVYYDVTNLTTDPTVTYLGSVSGLTQGSNPTTDALDFPNSYFGANFDASATVPEPASLLLLGGGLFGLGVIRRRRRA